MNLVIIIFMFLLYAISALEKVTMSRSDTYKSGQILIVQTYTNGPPTTTGGLGSMD